MDFTSPNTYMNMRMTTGWSTKGSSIFHGHLSHYREMGENSKDGFEIVVMGSAGSGKSTVSGPHSRLAQPGFVSTDTYHPSSKTVY
ncbi:hypothetical protein FA15DRAFT_177096 [Coprinopsis marcescibilis]|uniref:Uncharacterized protein n=1 Tax=Coprinopsis marcescibilis TaxID=230819 RepID=A0A5C3KH45_COPMA|nr:hypothetical protein FA15DRAFT_177096 [Coprinopsis marcescibilis]